MPKTLLIACGALAREMLALIEANGWTHLTLECLPAKLHNRPERIPDAVRGKIREKRAEYDSIVVAYADCGTGGLLDRVLEEEGVARIGGPHCYSFYAGADVFNALHDEEPGSFYLTDYLARHFDTLITTNASSTSPRPRTRTCRNRRNAPPSSSASPTNTASPATVSWRSSWCRRRGRGRVSRDHKNENSGVNR
jgi:hypothetical protein